MTMDELSLIDLDNYPRIDAAGIGDFYLLGDGRVRILLFDWFRVDGVFRRQIVGMVTRPTANLREEATRFWREAFQMPPPADAMILRH